jgi:hypothetical protein
MQARAWTSWVALRLAQLGALVAMLLLIGSPGSPHYAPPIENSAFVRETLQRWCESHDKHEALQAVVLDVRFRPEPPLFAEGEGVVVAPIAIELAGSQHVLEIQSQPASLRKLTPSGVTALAWEYAGRVHRELRFVGLALVERPPLTRLRLPDKPTFAKLPSDLRFESLAGPRDLQEHGLEKCAAFHEWAVRNAGPPPHTAQILRLARAVSHGTMGNGDDVCAATRSGLFTPHWAEVAVVMAARELGIPAFGFAPASAWRKYLVGTWVDELGWVLLDLQEPETGWFSGGPPLVTVAPTLGGFEAASHDFWGPQAAAYAKESRGVQAISRTEWRGRENPAKTPTDTTEARSVPLSEVCK